MSVRLVVYALLTAVEFICGSERLLVGSRHMAFQLHRGLVHMSDVLWWVYLWVYSILRLVIIIILGFLKKLGLLLVVILILIQHLVVLLSLKLVIIVMVAYVRLVDVVKELLVTLVVVLWTIFIPGWRLDVAHNTGVVHVVSVWVRSGWVRVGVKILLGRALHRLWHGEVIRIAEIFILLLLIGEIRLPLESLRWERIPSLWFQNFNFAKRPLAI